MPNEQDAPTADEAVESTLVDESGVDASSVDATSEVDLDHPTEAPAAEAAEATEETAAEDIPAEPVTERQPALRTPSSQAGAGAPRAAHTSTAALCCPIAGSRRVTYAVIEDNQTEAHGNRTRRAAARAEHHRL